MKYFLKKVLTYNQKEHFDKIALSFMDKYDKILDVGCGEGRFIAHNPKKIVGIDHNQDTVNVCTKKGYNVRLGQAESIPFPDESLGAIHCSHMIEHLEPRQAHKLLTEINRVLYPGGVVCIRTPYLHDNFYSDLTHVKPYHPKAILHYLKIGKQSQRTLEDIDGFYKILLLKYRHKDLFFATQFKYLSLFSKMLYKIGIKRCQRTGYMLILEKMPNPDN